MADLWKEGEQSNPPATLELIEMIEAKIECPLPEDYREFMLCHNGQPDTVEPRIRLLPLTQKTMVLNKLLLATPWKEIIMYSDPSPNAEKMDLATDLGIWKDMMTSQIKLLPLTIEANEANGTIMYLALDCITGTVLEVFIDLLGKTLDLTPSAMDFRSYRLDGGLIGKLGDMPPLNCTQQ